MITKIAKKRQYRYGLGCKFQSLAASVGYQLVRQHGDKCRRESAFGKQAAKQIRELKSDEKRIGNHSRPQEVCQYHIPQKPVMRETKVNPPKVAIDLNKLILLCLKCFIKLILRDYRL